MLRPRLTLPQARQLYSMIIKKEAVASEEASFFLLFYEIRAAIASQSVKYLHIFGRMMFDSRASAELASAGFSILWMTSGSSGEFPYCFNGRICAASRTV